MGGRFGRLAGAPGTEIRPGRIAALGRQHNFHPAEAGKLAAYQLAKFRPHDHQPCLAVAHDGGHLGAGQAPVDRNDHHTGLGPAVHCFEEDVAVLADIDDTFAGSDAGAVQRGGNLIGMLGERQ